MKVLPEVKEMHTVFRTVCWSKKNTSRCTLEESPLFNLFSFFGSSASCALWFTSGIQSKSFYFFYREEKVVENSKVPLAKDMKGGNCRDLTQLLLASVCLHFSLFKRGCLFPCRLSRCGLIKCLSFILSSVKWWVSMMNLKLCSCTCVIFVFIFLWRNITPQKFLRFQDEWLSLVQCCLFIYHC